MARDMGNVKVKLRVPGVAETENIEMGKSPHIFNHMLEAVLDHLEGVWQDLGIGFYVTSGYRISSATFVENLFIFANTWEQSKFMIQGITEIIWNRYKWKWKPDSLELLTVHVPVTGPWEVDCGDTVLKYKVSQSLYALGGVLDALQPVETLMRHRFSLGQKVFYKHLRHFRGKAPISLKLQACDASPRATALFLCTIGHWSAAMLMEAVRWERHLLRLAFRMRPRPDDTNRMSFNQRTARKLDEWMTACKFKRIHVAILERFFAHVWHERTVANQLAKVRRDRDLDIWEAVKDIPAGKRKAEHVLHSRSGPQLQLSTLFVKVWGPHWRMRLDACNEEAEWKQMKKAFVSEACERLRLPKPFAGYQAVSVQATVPRQPDARDEYKVLPTPTCLQRDQLWQPFSAKPQLEFVVDNKTIAQLLNLETRICNLTYAKQIGKMRENLFLGYTRYFDYKCGFLSCFDWRPREFNKLSDRICNWVLDRKSDVLSLDLHRVASELSQGASLQIQSDGGFVDGAGAAAAVLVVYRYDGEKWQAEALGYKGVFVDNAASAFHAELLAADLAIQLALEITNDEASRISVFIQITDVHPI